MNNPGHLVWIPASALVGFVSSFIFGDVLTLPVDLYYLIYFGVIIAFFSTYIKKTRLNLREWFSRRVGWGVLVGLVSGVLIVQFVLKGPATERFTGAYLGWLVFWRGFFYGAIDGLLLSSFPWMVIWRAFNFEKKTLNKKVAFSFVAWFSILLVTTAYHLGYSDFRSQKIVQPIIGNTIISLPTMVSANPMGAPITHAIMHITAILHCPKTELFLPPHRD